MKVEGVMPRDKDYQQTLCADNTTGSAYALRCAERLTTARRWNNCAATSPARH